MSGNQSGKVLAKPPVSSLGGLALMLVFKRRQIGIRVSIELRYRDVFFKKSIISHCGKTIYYQVIKELLY